ncbi:MAG: gfo/Idh/MocA family oxidoreductase, partial [Longimicrobiales bacterium]
QNAESGLMPVVADEAAAYGYTGENRHFARAFLHGERPLLTFDEGLEVVRLLMSGYRSAEEERTLAYPPEGIEAFIPAVARGTWRPAGG